ncbi:hypothetical protein ACFL4G_13495, partial [Thermodesulfobacteriota bacterium]
RSQPPFGFPDRKFDFLWKSFAEDFCGISGDNREGLYVVCNHGTGPNDGAVSYLSAAGKDDRVESDPNVVADEKWIILDRFDRVFTEQAELMVEEKGVMGDTVGRVISPLSLLLVRAITPSLMPVGLVCQSPDLPLGGRRHRTVNIAYSPG